MGRPFISNHVQRYIAPLPLCSFTMTITGTKGLVGSQGMPIISLAIVEPVAITLNVIILILQYLAALLELAIFIVKLIIY